METKKLIVSPSMFDKLELQLRAKVQVEGDEEAVLFDEPVEFDDGFTMDIIVINSVNGPWVRGILYNDVLQSCDEGNFTDKRDSLAGNYTVGGHCVKVERSLKAFPMCPRCGNDMREAGTTDVVQKDGGWDAEVERFDCPEGHTILVLDTERIDDGTDQQTS